MVIIPPSALLVLSSDRAVEDPGHPAAAPDAATLHPAEFFLWFCSPGAQLCSSYARRCVTNTHVSVRTSCASVKVEIHLAFCQFLLRRAIKKQFI